MLQERLKLTLDLSVSNQHLPRAHTCFFTVDLPLVPPQSARTLTADELELRDYG